MADPSSKDAKGSGWLQEIWDTVKTFAIALILAFGVRTFAVQPFNIPSGSMMPTLLVGDFVFANKFAYGYGQYSFPFGLIGFEGRIFEDAPERGDVAVFRQPTNPSIDFIKRVIGVPGDRVQMIDGVLFLNGEAVLRERLPDVSFEDGLGRMVRTARFRETLPNGVSYEILEARDDGPLDNTPTFVVPEGHYFMMGDNRDFSQDSRVLDAVGYVPLENFVGPAMFIWFSIGDDARFWQLWKWPTSVRFDRLFDGI